MVEIVKIDEMLEKASHLKKADKKNAKEQEGDISKNKNPKVLSYIGEALSQVNLDESHVQQILSSCKGLTYDLDNEASKHRLDTKLFHLITELVQVEKLDDVLIQKVARGLSADE